MVERSRANGVALITGAGSGIGAATVRRLAAAGARGLVLVDLNSEALDAVSTDLQTREIMKFARDVRDERAWSLLEEEVYTHFGQIDMAVVNAGVAAGGQIVDTTLEDWRAVVSVNLDGAFLALRTAMRLMTRGGAIVIVSSVAATKAEAGVGAYAASKAGAAMLAKTAAKEGAAKGIRVNAILPGGVETPIWDNVPMFKALVEAEGGREGAFAAMAKQGTPLGRFAVPEEIAEQIAFLLSPAAGTITGAWIVSDGGYAA